VKDVIRWDENFYTARIGGRDVVDRLQTPGTSTTGRHFRTHGAWRSVVIEDFGSSSMADRWAATART